MRKLLAVLLTCTMVCGFVGCGTSKDVAEKSDNLKDVAADVASGEADAEDIQEAMDDYADAIDGNITGFQDINEYISAILASDEYATTLQTVESSGMSLELLADGNNLVYKYTYTIELADNASEIMQQSLVDNDSVMESSANTIRIEAPCVEKVVWEYYSMDGTLLASAEK